MMGSPDIKKDWPVWITRLAENRLIVIVGLVGVVFTIIGIIVMVMLYVAAQTERELVYAVNPIKTRVVTMGQATGLEIIHNGAKLGDVDITASQIAIWNCGDESIRKENILKEVIIYTDPAVPILEVSIVSHSRDVEVTGFAVFDSPEMLKIGKVPVSWHILEKNDGASIQLIYLGSSQVDICVQGLVEGSGTIKRIGREVKIKTPVEQIETERTLRWFLVFVVVYFFAFSIYMGMRVYKRWTKEGKTSSTYIGLTLIILSIGCASACLWYLFSRGPLAPPFGF